MSNRRKVRPDGTTPAERCTSCGRRTGRYAVASVLRLRTGQVICPRCREHGGLQRMACGHVVTPGSLVINDNGDGSTYRCAQCSPEAAQFGNARLGLGRRIS